jgi:hypothetical protein
MRTAVVLVLVALTCLFVWQKRSAPIAAANAQQVTAPARPVSEHDWAKHALDTAGKVKADVLRQRASNDPR